MTTRRALAEATGASAPPPGVDRFTLALVVAIAIGLGVFGTYLSQLSPARGPSVGDGATVLAAPKPIPEFSLADQHGVRFDRSRLEGRWTLLFFGYTYCPDVCPFVLQEVARVMEIWRQAPTSPVPQVVFVSVDPERDTPERLDEYVNFFDPALLGVSGDPSDLARLAEAVGAFYERRKGNAEGTLVDHSSNLFLVDPAARFFATLDDPHDPQAFAALVARVQATGAIQ